MYDDEERTFHKLTNTFPLDHSVRSMLQYLHSHGYLTTDDVYPGGFRVVKNHSLSYNGEVVANMETGALFLGRAIEVKVKRIRNENRKKSSKPTARWRGPTGL